MIQILATIALCCSVAYGQTTVKQESDDKKAKTLEDWETLNGANYSIQYPFSWEVNQSGLMGTSFFLFSPLETEKDQFKENVNLLIQNLTGLNFDLDKFANLSEQQVKTMITNSTIIESKRVKSAGREYHKMLYAGDQGIFYLKFEQYYWVENDKAYILTFTCEQDRFFAFREVGENIMNSFVLNK